MEKNLLNNFGTQITCSLIIAAEVLEVEELQSHFSAKQCQIIKKDEVLSSTIPPAPYDCFSFDFRGELNECAEMVLQKFISAVIPLREYLQEKTKAYDMYVKIFVQSDFAQIAFDISPTTIEQLSELKLPIKISVLSWGGIADNE